MTTSWDMTLRALPGIPLVQAGDDLGQLIAWAARADGLDLHDGDVVVVAQKVVPKAEGRVVALAGVTPGERAQRLGKLTGRDPRLCQLYLDEARAVLQLIGRHVVTLDRRGFVDTPLVSTYRTRACMTRAGPACCRWTRTHPRAASGRGSAS